MRPKFAGILCCALAASTLQGCRFWPHSLHYNQLWKMNRQEPWDEGHFSIADPVDERLLPAASDQPAGDRDGH